jgi:hypothetical protein
VSDVASGIALTGYGRTCRKDVLGRVLVLGVPCATAGHVPWRVPRLSSTSGCPQAEHVLLEGYQRAITIRCRPALYSSMRRKVPHPQSEIAFASLWLRTMFLTGANACAAARGSRSPPLPHLTDASEPAGEVRRLHACRVRPTSERRCHPLPFDGDIASGEDDDRNPWIGNPCPAAGFVRRRAVARRRCCSG